MTAGMLSQISNHKSQIPDKSQVPNSKFKTTEHTTIGRIHILAGSSVELNCLPWRCLHI
jgi:hypothetical protein